MVIFVIIFFISLRNLHANTRAEPAQNNTRKKQTRITRGNRAKRRRAEPARTINTSTATTTTSSSSSSSSSKNKNIVDVLKIRL